MFFGFLIIEKFFNGISFIHSGIEWYPLNQLNLKEDQYKSAVKLLESLEEDDDVQNVYTNLKGKKLN